jgi:hypothetical protein
VFVLPQEATSNKTCATLVVPLKPLCLHERVPGISDAHRESLPLSEITITGKFSMDDAMQWVSNILPDVPRSNSEDDKAVSLFYESSLLHTHLLLEIQTGSIRFLSDNFSIMAICKD